MNCESLKGVGKIFLHIFAKKGTAGSTGGWVTKHGWLTQQPHDLGCPFWKSKRKMDPVSHILASSAVPDTVKILRKQWGRKQCEWRILRKSCRNNYWYAFLFILPWIHSQTLAQCLVRIATVTCIELYMNENKYAWRFSLGKKGDGTQVCVLALSSGSREGQPLWRC